MTYRIQYVHDTLSSLYKYTNKRFFSNSILFCYIFNLQVAFQAFIVQTGQGLGEMPQLQILTIISESVLLTCIRLYSGSVGSLATSSHQSQPSLHYRYTVYILYVFSPQALAVECHVARSLSFSHSKACIDPVTCSFTYLALAWV